MIRHEKESYKYQLMTKNSKHSGISFPPSQNQTNNLSVLPELVSTSAMVPNSLYTQASKQVIPEGHIYEDFQTEFPEVTCGTYYIQVWFAREKLNPSHINHNTKYLRKVKASFSSYFFVGLYYLL